MIEETFLREFDGVGFAVAFMKSRQISEEDTLSHHGGVGGKVA
jgi:hypothetical protein